MTHAKEPQANSPTKKPDINNFNEPWASMSDEDFWQAFREGYEPSWYGVLVEVAVQGHTAKDALAECDRVIAGIPAKRVGGRKVLAVGKRL